MYKSIFALLAVAFVAGCGTPPPQLTRDQYLAMSSRTFDAPKDKVLVAAEKVLRLADGDDFKIHHNAAGFNAQRAWLAYFVFGGASGTDFWAVRTNETPPGKTRVELEVGTVASTVAPMAVPGVGMTAGTLPSTAAPVQGPALYELFFERLSFLLGGRPDWPTCEWSDKMVKSKATWGNNEALCNSFNMTDSKPDAGSLVR